MHCSTQNINFFFFLFPYFPAFRVLLVRCAFQTLGTQQFNLLSVDCVFFCGSSATKRSLKRPSLPAAVRSCGRRPVGVAQHGVEGAGEVVGAGAAGRVLRQRDQTRQQEEEEQEELQREGGAEHPIEEGASRWGVLLLSAGGARRDLGEGTRFKSSVAGWNKLKETHERLCVSVTSWELSLCWSSRPLLRQSGLPPSHNPGFET